MTYLLVYDITNDKLRKKIADCLIAQGFERLQFSVFIGNRNLENYKDIWTKLTDWVTQDNGKMAIVSITEPALRNMIMLGEHPVDIDYLLGKKFCIFV